VGTERSLPGFFERRDALFAAQPNRDRLRGQGQIFLEAGLLDNALEFFVKAEDLAGLAHVEEAARRTGDAFSMETALKALGKTAAPADWAAVGETALEAGLLWFAYRAFEKADHQDGLERTRREMHAAGITPAQR
jgi:hypothetical protein